MIRRLLSFKVSNLIRIFNLQFYLLIMRWQPISLLIVSFTLVITVWFFMMVMREYIVKLSYLSKRRFRSHTCILFLFYFNCCYIETDIHVRVWVSRLLDFIALKFALLIFKNDEHHANNISGLGRFDFVND